MTLDYVPAKVPVFGDVLSIVLEICTTGVLSFCLSRILFCPGYSMGMC
jgi:hypothetical protein